jgi:hypothetical protein
MINQVMIKTIIIMKEQGPFTVNHPNKNQVHLSTKTNQKRKECLTLNQNFIFLHRIAILADAKARLFELSQ